MVNNRLRALTDERTDIMNKLTRKIASIITAAAVAFGSIGALPDTGILPDLAVTASADGDTQEAYSWWSFKTRSTKAAM